MPGSGLGARHTVVSMSWLVLSRHFWSSRGMGNNQNTLQVDANKGTITIVLIEEEELKENGDIEPDLVLPIK